MSIAVRVLLVSSATAWPSNATFESANVILQRPARRPPGGSDRQAALSRCRAPVVYCLAGINGAMRLGGGKEPGPASVPGILSTCGGALEYT